MVAILEKYEQTVDFHPIVDFVEASHIRIETMKEGTKILTAVDGNLRSVFESSIRRNLKLNDEAGISSLPNAELFKNLSLMGYNISPNQKFTFQKGQFSHQWKYLIHTIIQCLSPKSNGFNEFSSNIATALVCLATNRGEGSGTPTEPHHTPSHEAQQTSPTTHSSPSLPPDTTATIPPVIPTDTPQLRYYTRRARIAQSSALPPVADEPAYIIGDVSQGEACLTVSGLEAEQDRANITKTSTLPSDSTPRVTSLAADEGNDAPIKGRSLDEREEAAEKGSNDTEEMINVLTSLDASTVLSSRVAGVPIGSDVVPAASPIFATATVVTPYTRRKGKEKMVETDTPKKKKLQEQIDHLDREDLNQLWALVKESLSIRPASSDKEMELWVELKRLYEPDVEDQLWTHTQNMMHSPVEWKLYGTCGFHHVTFKNQEIFMLMEKDYHLRKALALVMICYTLQVENYSKWPTT
nr:synaptobrevin, longin-like domain protein [Tanacetum cinerariifolium]